MSSEDQTICPKCSQEYSESNPPRLLTMCGHTFCEKCIKELILKKRVNNKYRVICPLDKMNLQISNPSPTCFPKNLSILSMVKKKADNDSKNKITNRISNIGKIDQPSFGSVTTLSNLQNQIQSPLASTSGNTIKQQRKQSMISLGEGSSDLCLLHLKPLQLVCVRDCQRICASCVIFGEHRGHVVKNVSEVDEMVCQLTEKLKGFLHEHENNLERLKSQEIVKKLEAMLQNKKVQMQKQISKKFKMLIDQVVQIEKKTQERLLYKIQQYEKKVKQNLNDKIIVKQKLKQWEDSLNQKIQILTHQNDQQKIKLALKSDGFIESSQKNLVIFKDMQKTIIQQSKIMVQNLALSYDETQILRCLKQYCKFQDCSNSFLDMNESRANFSHFLNQESLLDDPNEGQMRRLNTSIINQFEQRISRQHKKMIPVTPKIRKNTTANIFDQVKLNQTQKIERVKSSNMRIFTDVSPNRRVSTTKSSKALNLNSSILNMIKSKQIPQKYEQKIQSVVKGTTDVLDLTNGELGNEIILAILQKLKYVTVPIVKLVRNKITDDYISQMLPYLDNVVMLNLSRNELTQKSVLCLLKARKEGRLKSLKSLMIGQNRIIQRKNKQYFEELKKMGLNVCI